MSATLSAMKAGWFGIVNSEGASNWPTAVVPEPVILFIFKTLPAVNFSSERIKTFELAPYRKLISEGLSSVMVAHLDIPSISRKGLPTSLSKEVIQKFLKITAFPF